LQDTLGTVGRTLEAGCRRVRPLRARFRVCPPMCGAGHSNPEEGGTSCSLLLFLGDRGAPCWIVGACSWLLESGPHPGVSDALQLTA